MNIIKKIKTSESSIPRLEEIKNQIFDANQDNKMWQTINSFLIGFKMGSTDFTKFAKFVIFKDNYKTMYNWILVNKNYYEIFQPFMRNLKRFYDTIKRKEEVFFGEIYMNKKEGTMIYLNGAVYVGEWKDDKINGKGTYTYPSGDVYVGDFKDGKINGKGTCTFACGNVYDGDWKDKRPHGNGKMTYVDGRVYVGEFKDGKRHGKGTYTWADGRVYVGEFKDVKRHGKGKRKRYNE